MCYMQFYILYAELLFNIFLAKKFTPVLKPIMVGLVYLSERLMSTASFNFLTFWQFSLLNRPYLRKNNMSSSLSRYGSVERQKQDKK